MAPSSSQGNQMSGKLWLNQGCIVCPRARTYIQIPKESRQQIYAHLWMTVSVACSPCSLHSPQRSQGPPPLPGFPPRAQCVSCVIAWPIDSSTSQDHPWRPIIECNRACPSHSLLYLTQYPTLLLHTSPLWFQGQILLFILVPFWTLLWWHPLPTNLLGCHMTFKFCLFSLSVPSSPFFSLNRFFFSSKWCYSVWITCFTSIFPMAPLLTWAHQTHEQNNSVFHENLFSLHSKFYSIA